MIRLTVQARLRILIFARRECSIRPGNQEITLNVRCPILQVR
jgi:hypothetical protein